MWIGRKPATLASVENAAAAEEFANAITDACVAKGCDLQDYVAAAGPYGSWLVRFRKDDQRQRIVWNGKSGQLVLEQATAGIEWDQLAVADCPDRTATGFVAAINGLLQGRPG
jgi:hypothetical protein